MTQRVIVSVIAIPIIFLIVIFAPAWVLGLLMGLVAARCAWEFLYVAEKDAPLRVSVYAAVSAFGIPFLSALTDPGTAAVLFVFLLCAAMFGELMWSFRKRTTMEFETVAVTLLAGGVIPLLLAGIVRLHLRESGNLYALLVFIVVFSNDIFCYLVGVALGRHKVAPRISPQKSLEGCIGGFLAAILISLLYGSIVRGAGYEVNQAVMGVYGFLGALAAQLGDLSFSAVKRLFGVKDYGRLIPGHGGMMDRFDSMVWAAPLIELLVAWVPAIIKIVE